MIDEDVATMDVWKNSVQQDINDLKSGQSRLENEQNTMKTDIHKLQMSDQLQNQEINMLKETLKNISEDTKWIRRKITSAIITALITGVIGGVIALFFANF